MLWLKVLLWFGNFKTSLIYIFYCLKCIIITSDKENKNQTDLKSFNSKKNIVV